MQYKILDPQFEQRVRVSFARQAAIALIGAIQQTLMVMHGMEAEPRV
jgi:hypothetical protein